MDAHSRRQAALSAIQAVLGGAIADSAETDIVDFKEEEGTVTSQGTRVAISDRHQLAAQRLAEEVACLAMSNEGGILVVGVDDKGSGPAAFRGAYLDTAWLRERIHTLTTPSLSVDVIEEQIIAGQRIYLINVAPALEEIRVGGKLRARFDRRCVELTGDRAREFLENRRRYDWSAEASVMRFSDATPEALASARRHYEEEHGTAPGSDLELVRRLGVTMEDGSDPMLNQAGALLLCEFEQGIEQIEVLVTVAEGAASRQRRTLTAPLLPAFDSGWELILSTFPAESAFVGAQRRRLRTLPEGALREALVNAVMHRDYRQPRNRIVSIVSGDPAADLKVRSPGGFPPGVGADRLLATASRPRNPALALALRTLGLAEHEGVGITTMYRLMLRDGHKQPEIVEDGGDVVCSLLGGQSDQAVRAFFDGLYALERTLEYDVRAHIAITELLTEPTLRVDRLALVAQCTPGEAEADLERLVQVGAVERLVNRSRSFRLTLTARQALQARISYRTRQSIDEHFELIRAYLDTRSNIGREEAAELLNVDPSRATQILVRLRDSGHLNPVGGRTRGRGVRYELGVAA